MPVWSQVIATSSISLSIVRYSIGSITRIEVSRGLPGNSGAAAALQLDASGQQPQRALVLVAFAKQELAARETLQADVLGERAEAFALQSVERHELPEQSWADGWLVRYVGFPAQSNDIRCDDGARR